MYPSTGIQTWMPSPVCSTVQEAPHAVFQAQLTNLANVRCFFRPDCLRHLAPMTASPFFIVGCGRSGTSLLRSMLNRHPRVAIPLESLFIIDYLRASSLFPLEQLKSMLVREPEVKEWGLNVSVADLASCPSIVNCIAKLHMLYAAQAGADVWGQKTPRFVRHLDLLQDHFPTARFVHMIRDPRGVVNSLIRSDVHRSDAYHASLRWLKDVRCGLAFEASQPDVTLRIRYADLVTRPDDVLDQVFEFLGLSPDVRQEAPPNTGGAEYSDFYANIHKNLSRQPTTAFIDKWRKELSHQDLEIVEAMCGSEMVELGFEREMASPRLGQARVRRMKVRRVFLTFLQTLRYLRYRRAYLGFLLWRKWRLGLLKEFLWNVNF